jgi:hypothetical protein
LSKLGEIARFLITRKRYWMLPMMVVILVFAVLLVLAETSPAAPFIYTLF